MLNPILIVSLLSASGLFFGCLALARMHHRRWLAAGRSSVGAALCLTLAGIAIALAFNLYTYRRLSYEQPVAQLHFTALSNDVYRADLRTPDGHDRALELTGNEWQLDARVLKWRPLANLMGFDALYRLERLSGRYRDVAQENTDPHTAYTLTRGDRGLSVWDVAREVPHWVALVDTEYGSAAYLPMADGAEYAVVLTQSGLVARPANGVAREAIRRW